MSLLTERSPPPTMPGKRQFEEGNSQSPKILSKFKRSNAVSIRSFPRLCGPFASESENGNLDFSGVDMVKSSKAGSGMAVVAIEAKPLRTILPPSDLNNDFKKLNAADDGKIEAIRQQFNLKNEKFYSAMSPRKANWDDLLGNAASPKGKDDLANLKTSPQSLPIATRYQTSKIPYMSPSICHISPDDEMDHYSFSPSRAFASGRSNSEIKPLKVTTETRDRSNGDEDDDCVIIKEKSSNAFEGNAVNDQHVSSPQQKLSHRVQAQTSSRCILKREEDDEDVCILSDSGWKLVQSGFKSLDKTEKNNKPEFLDKEYRAESFAEVSEKLAEAEELKDTCIVPYDAAMDLVSRKKVQEALERYDEKYRELLDEQGEESNGGRKKQVHVRVAMLLKKEQEWINIKPSFGHIPGVEIGDQFQFRAELALVGLHHELVCGINYVTIEGKQYATSVVDSGRYDNKVKSPNVLVYSGQGGNPKVYKDNFEDQKLEGGNLALKNSMYAKLPVRVTRKSRLAYNDATATRKKMYYIYDGLYNVSRFWPERSENGKFVFMFELVRMSGQPDCNHLTMSKARRSIENYGQGRPVAAEADDVSQGKEKIPIMVVNTKNNEQPPPFTYITKMKYPHWYEYSLPSGCNCIGGCSDSELCPCALKNKGGELPYNEEGAIVKAKQMVYECGPNCKCPPSCQNRVSQHGPRLPLELFRTNFTGWGVRCQDDILSGSFICEYIGELLEDKEADRRSNDEYLFDLDGGDGFTIDAAKYGNVGRFINHSCSPNLYAQNVLYDNDDKRLPHIMLFATKKIPAFQELTYDYNYKLDRVCDANGNIKKKWCCCGSRKCNGRMY